jgi:hypothetical protein
MRTFLLIVFCTWAISGLGQFKISELPTYTGDPAGSWVPIVQSGITKKVNATNFLTTAVRTTGSYSNPSWLTAVDWTKLTSVPTLTINGTAQDISANRTWSLGLQSITDVSSITTNGGTFGGLVQSQGYNLANSTNVLAFRQTTDVTPGSHIVYFKNMGDLNHQVVAYEDWVNNAYTAGYGTIKTGTQFSVDTTLIQRILSAGAGIGITGNTIYNTASTLQGVTDLDSVTTHDIRVNGITIGKGSGAGGFYRDNTVFGDSAYANNGFGYQSAGFGYHVLKSQTTAGGNSGFGAYVLENTTTGGFNSGFGRLALTANTTGVGNTGIGDEALQANTTGTKNVAVGWLSQMHTTTGYGNVGVGYASLFANTTGDSSTAIGLGALHENTSGRKNVALGGDAGRGITTGSFNLCIGDSAYVPNYTGNYQMSIANFFYGVNINGRALNISSGMVGVRKFYPIATWDINGALAVNKDSVDRTTGKTWFLVQDTTTGKIMRQLIPDASGSTSGLVNTTTQTFAGAKTFSSAPSFSSLTTKSIPFIGASGLLSEDNSNLVWDNTNKWLAVGIGTPEAQIHTWANTSTPAATGVKVTNGSTTGYANLTFRNNSASAQIFYAGTSHASYAGKLAFYNPNSNGFQFVGGKTTFEPSTTAGASLNIAAGTAPTSPANGDLWVEGTDLKFRIGGVTYTITKS